ncbi:GLPGLI family protein [Haloflavibacter putidus]|uniref:GLPGLI family protein n=1 Tax=Haloflavibacter putidus TaxID=2576776 RepID=A0A508A499_9FLAO|nr:GLPGLI family protein [Haloflavibacter putidus]TQD40692.1 GLPGLI family protein [Haloflavibacter putidus]
MLYKKFVITAVVLFSQILYSQSSGKLTYALDIELTDYSKMKTTNPQQYKKYRKIDRKAREIANSLEYKLLFKNDKSIFKRKNILTKNNNSPFLKIAIAPIQGIFYNDLACAERLQQTEDFGKTYLIFLPELEWQISNETKTIGTYACQKATTEKTYYNKDGELKTQKVIAWFTKSVPINHGPLAYAGLPGLIVQLKVDKRIFTLEEIDKKENTIEITRPKGKAINLKNYYKLFSTAMQSMR